MEDAHTTILDLDEDGSSEKKAFFAVYDGHGGACSQLRVRQSLQFCAGATVAQFAGRNVHKRLTRDETYQEKLYDAALKKAFLGTDEDIRAGIPSQLVLRIDLTSNMSSCATDPSFFRDPSGCTAVAALLTSDRKLYVVRAIFAPRTASY